MGKTIGSTSGTGYAKLRDRSHRGSPARQIRWHLVIVVKSAAKRTPVNTDYVRLNSRRLKQRNVRGSVVKEISGSERILNYHRH